MRRNVRKRVLVVDDDQTIREMLQTILELENYEPIIAENGLVALEKLETVKPDLILLDLMMPEMDGFAFVEELQRRERCSLVPILVLSAGARMKTRAEQMGLHNYLEKPFELIHFLDELTKLLYSVEVC
jgi:CheY-like chemotaxis protein